MNEEYFNSLPSYKKSDEVPPNGYYIGQEESGCTYFYKNKPYINKAECLELYEFVWYSSNEDIDYILSNKLLLNIKRADKAIKSLYQYQNGEPVHIDMNWEYDT